MKRERFEQIFNETESKLFSVKGDSALAGLLIINKYLPEKGIEAAEHDEIYSVDVDEIIEAGITEEDAIKLAELNWHIDEDCDSLACFV